VGCDKKILWPSAGLQSGLIGTGWSSLALLAKSIHRQGLTEEVRAAESTFRLERNILWCEAVQLLSGGAGASHREILEKLPGMVLSRWGVAGSGPGAALAPRRNPTAYHATPRCRPPTGQIPKSARHRSSWRIKWPPSGEFSMVLRIPPAFSGTASRPSTFGERAILTIESGTRRGNLAPIAARHPVNLGGRHALGCPFARSTNQQPALHQG